MMESKDGVSQTVVTNDLLPNDVLLGRGTGPNEHLGNCLFRDEVENHKDAYISAPDKATEEKVVNDIISSIQKNRGRFLRKMDSHHQQDLSGKNKPLYEVVVDRKVLAYKIKQAIRYSKRRDKKMEASKEVKTSDGSEMVQAGGGTSEAAASSSQAVASQVQVPSTSRPFGMTPPNNLLSSESERLLLMTQNASNLPAGMSQSQLLVAGSQHTPQELQRVLGGLAQSQLIYPAGGPQTLAQNPLTISLDQSTTINSTLSPDVLDQLAILHLQRTDPLAYQLVIDRRRQQQQQQQEAAKNQMESLQRHLGLSTTEQQHQLLQERSALLRMPTAQHIPSQSSTIADPIRNTTSSMLTPSEAPPPVLGQRRGSIDTFRTGNNTADEDSEVPGSKRHKEMS